MASINFRVRDGGRKRQSDAWNSDEQLVTCNAFELSLVFREYVGFITWMDAAALPSDKYVHILKVFVQRGNKSGFFFFVSEEM